MFELFFLSLKFVSIIYFICFKPVITYKNIKSIKSYPNFYLLSKKYITVPEIPNGTRNTLQYQKYITVPEIHNCTRQTLLYQKYLTVPEIHNCTRNTELLTQCVQRFIYKINHNRSLILHHCSIM